MSSISANDTAIRYLRPELLRKASLTSTAIGTAIDVGIEGIRDIGQLEILWRNLEARASHSFYLSWLWIGTWLRHLPDGADPQLVTARMADRIVGLAILCRRRTWHLGWRRRQRWLLHETGDLRYDRLFIEHNAILADQSLEDAVLSTCLEAMLLRLGPTDELILSGIGSAFELVARRAADASECALQVKLADTAPWVDFVEVRRRGGDYRATLGRNTRQAVSRTMRLYAERGPIQHRIMDTPAEALTAFNELIRLHWSRWGRKGPFANSGFCAFHEDIIMRGVPAGAVRISRTVVGERTIGILYNFVHHGRVLNYQSGFLYEQDARLKPGLVSHVLSIEDSLRRDECGYDFLAGPAGHKSRLANAESTMVWMNIGKSSLERRIEAGIQQACRKIRAMMIR